MRKRLSEIHPLLYDLRIWQKRTFRQIADLRQLTKFAAEISTETLAFSCKRHQSLLRRKLGNSDPQLQENKITNLAISTKTIDGILIKPNETFSFWKQVGEATAEKGYLEGMQLSRGEVVRGVGGGLCQLANLLYWMALHTQLTIAERHHHSFDPFPDEQRTLPFGSGAGVFFNYIDLRFHNPTDLTFQIKVWLTDQHLKGAIYSDKETPFSYHVFEKNHRFLKKDEVVYRENEIWREMIHRKTGNKNGEELLVKNFAEIKYDLPEDVCCEIV
jgi:vancomycin resistance protein VanW